MENVQAEICFFRPAAAKNAAPAPPAAAGLTVRPKMGYHKVTKDRLLRPEEGPRRQRGTTDMQNAKNLYILSGTEAFTRGELDNVALTENGVCLEQVAGRHVLYGCFTSQPVNLPAFDRLVMSWNAETPPGTVVEAQARVRVGEEWSGWLSFGKWSPYIRRASVTGDESQTVFMWHNVLHVAKGRAVQAQLRIYLYTEDERLTPRVWLLAASVRPVEREEERPAIYSRVLHLPAYSQKLRDPALRDGMSTPVTLASLLNRWGQDVLPEELAQAMLDHGDTDMGTRNFSFAAALAGCYGYRAYLAYLSPERLWQCVKQGDSVGVFLRYAASEEQAAASGKAFLPGAFADVEAQMMALRGFDVGDAGAFALVNDSLAPTNAEAERAYPLDAFLQAYQGLALVITGRQKGRGEGCPHRRRVGLRALEQVGGYMFQDENGKDLPLPADFAGTLACAVSDGTVHATTAHKSFRFVKPTAQGGVQLPPDLFDGKGRITVYAIGPDGCTLVGDAHRNG